MNWEGLPETNLEIFGRCEIHIGIGKLGDIKNGLKAEWFSILYALMKLIHTFIKNLIRSTN